MSYNGAGNLNPSPGTRYVEKKLIMGGAGSYPWTECFVWWPQTTINGKRIWWTKAFKRRVWVVWGTGFHMEPETQYGTSFDIIDDPWESQLHSERWGG